MNRRRMVLAIAAVLVLAALGWLASLSKTSQAAPAPTSEVSFKGKVLLVSTGNVYTLPFVLEKVHVQKIGDRNWLMGKGADLGAIGRLYKGRTVRVQMEHIVSITEFDDLKEAKKAFASGGGWPIAIGGYGIGGYTGTGVEPLPTTPAPQAVPPAGEKGLPPPKQKE